VGEARQAADLYCETATSLGLAPIVFITDATVAHQPHIGRGEVLRGLRDLLHGTGANPWAERHIDLCARMADTISSMRRAEVSKRQSIDRYVGRASGDDMIVAMESNLEAQGSSKQQWLDRVDDIARQKTHPVRASTSGFVHYFLDRVRDLVTQQQGRELGPDSSPADALDHFGCTLTSEPGTAVTTGETVMLVRGTPPDGYDLASLFAIRDHPGPEDNQLLETVTA
jgi:thymidine phosphorylase